MGAHLMSGFIQGEAQHQTTIFPKALDDYITEENPISVIYCLNYMRKLTATNTSCYVSAI